MKQLPKISYSLFGKYRAELMGIAILNVLLLHSNTWSKINSCGWAITILNVFGRLILTEGFLFLSGFGLYYSLYKNYDLRQFFTKRIQRLIIPYWLMSLPFFATWFITGKIGVGGLLLRLSTLQFWFNKNAEGMWYISISVLLYIFTPLIFKKIQKNMTVVVLLINLAIITTLALLAPEYYDMIKIGIAKTPFFILGVYSGKQSIEKKQLNILWLAGLVILLAALYMHSTSSILLVAREYTLRLVGLTTCCLLMKVTDSFSMLHRILRWMGQYTLELYIFHLLIYISLQPIELNNGYIEVAISIIGAFLLCVPTQIICKKIISQQERQQGKN